MAANVPSVAQPANNKKNECVTARLLWKTRQCIFFAKGNCARGSACTFAHGSADSRVAPDFSYTQRCKSFIKTGQCQHGAGCKFAHTQGEVRPWESKKRGQTHHRARGGASPPSLPPQVNPACFASDKAVSESSTNEGCVSHLPSEYSVTDKAERSAGDCFSDGFDALGKLESLSGYQIVVKRTFLQFNTSDEGVRGGRSASVPPMRYKL
jgi:hypothetical protein